MAYGLVRGTGKVIRAGRGEIHIELGLSTDGTGCPAKDAYLSGDSGVTGHVATRCVRTPNHLGPLWLHETHYESWDAAT